MKIASCSSVNANETDYLIVEDLLEIAAGVLDNLTQRGAGVLQLQ